MAIPVLCGLARAHRRIDSRSARCIAADALGDPGGLNGRTNSVRHSRRGRFAPEHGLF